MVNRAFHEDETEYAKSLCKIAGTFQNQSMLVWMEYSELTRKTRCPPCLIWPQPVALQHPVLIGPTASGCRSRSRISSLRGRHHAFYNGRRTIVLKSRDLIPCMCDLTSGPQVHHLYSEELGPFHQELSALFPEERGITITQG